MIVNKELANSKGCDNKDKWSTPKFIFNYLDRIFNFTLDPCCEKETALCDVFFTEEDDGLIQDWGKHTVYCNPPYSRGNIDKWMEKCFIQSLKGNTIVCLIPVSSSAGWWHKYILGEAHIVYFKGRIKFVGAKHTAPFSSCIAIFNNNSYISSSINISEIKL